MEDGGSSSPEAVGEERDGGETRGTSAPASSHPRRSLSAHRALLETRQRVCLRATRHEGRCQGGSVTVRACDGVQRRGRAGKA
eukprot:644258-Rhodomonas_salina.1